MDTCSRDPAFGVRNLPPPSVRDRRVLLDVSEDVLLSFCVAGVAHSTWQKMCSCRFEWQGWHFVTFDVFQEEYVCATVAMVMLACLWGKPQKRVFLDVAEDVFMSFCVAGVVFM